MSIHTKTMLRAECDDCGMLLPNTNTTCNFTTFNYLWDELTAREWHVTDEGETYCENCWKEMNQ